MTILVVDDDRSVREALKQVLEAEGWRVMLAADGEAAVASCSSQAVDLLVLDLGLPLRSGWDAFEQITAANPLMPILVITGQSKQFEIAVAAGVGAFLEKPVDVPRLIGIIRELMTEPMQTRLERLCGRRHDTRHVAADSRAFMEDLRRRYETPFRVPRIPASSRAGFEFADGSIAETTVSPATKRKDKQ